MAQNTCIQEPQYPKEFLESIDFFETVPQVCTIDHKNRIKCFKVKMRSLKVEIHQLEKQQLHVHRLYRHSRALRFACLKSSAQRIMVDKCKQYEQAKSNVQGARKARDNQQIDKWIVLTFGNKIKQTCNN